MVRRGHVAAGVGALAVALACGPEDGGLERDDAATTAVEAMSSSGGRDDGGGVTAPADGEDASADASTSTTTSSSSSSSDGATTTGEPVVACDCGPDEICVLHPTDSCPPLDLPYIPSTECVPTPEACDGLEPACDTECGWELCGGPACHGFFDGEVCSTPTQGFLCSGSGSFQCNLFTQDCPRGEKCTSWSSDLDEVFDATRCAPVEPDAVPIGGACTVENSGVSGVDDCELGAMCLDVDPETLTGICRSACVGNPYGASCKDPAMQCSVMGEIFAWCMPA